LVRAFRASAAVTTEIVMMKVSDFTSQFPSSSQNDTLFVAEISLFRSPGKRMQGIASPTEFDARMSAMA
jgi:hypothetical protein